MAQLWNPKLTHSTDSPGVDQGARYREDTHALIMKDFLIPAPQAALAQAGMVRESSEGRRLQGPLSKAWLSLTALGLTEPKDGI